MLLLSAMLAAMLWSSAVENDSYDEGGHLVAGYARLTLGELDFNAEHPPLGNMFSALPLLPLKPRLATEHPSWRQRAAPIAGAIFLYRNRVRPDILLFLGRLPAMAATLVLGVMMAVWARRHLGRSVALLALFLYATDPNFIAHGRHITTDIYAACLFFAASITWARYLETGARRALLLSGFVLGLALATKFSSVLLPPVFIVMYLLHRGWRKPQFLIGCLACFAIAVTIVVFAYWPETRTVLAGEKAISQHLYLKGLQYVNQHNQAGHPAYLLGQISDRGWWYYFPVVFALKTPAVTLLLTVLAVFLIPRWREPAVAHLPWITLAVPPLAYFALSMTSHINLGVRHLLPVYPFVFIIAAAAFFRVSGRLPRKLAPLVLFVLALLQVLETARIAPHFLAFFNSFTGGPERGGRYLADSNIDWGQDAKALAAYLKAHGTNEVCLAYFGTTDIAYHGLQWKPLPLTWQPDQRAHLDCLAAISLNLLRGLYVKPGAYDWLLAMKPVAAPGHSIYVYDLRRKPGLTQPQAPGHNGIVHPARE